MSSGGGRFERRLLLRELLEDVDAFEPCLDSCACGEGTGKAVASLDDATALSGGCWPPYSDAERGGAAERSGAPGPRGEGLIVDEKGTYIADGGMPVGVDVRSGDEPEPEPELEEPYSSDGGEAGVTVADIHAECKIFADLLAERLDRRGVPIGSRVAGVPEGASVAGVRVILSESNVDVRRAELFMVDERSAEDLIAAERSVPVRGCFSEGRRICGVPNARGLDHVVRMGDEGALCNASRVLNHG